jgi:hypothetical protein
MISFTLHLYREGSRWFFDDPRKGIEHEEFVGGVPKFLYYLAGRTDIKECDITIDAQKVDGVSSLVRVDSGNPHGGIYYLHEESGLEIWLCPVFWNYFKPPIGPQKIWVSLHRLII